MNNYKFSFILSYRHNNQRWDNLRRVLDWVSGFSGVEIIIVEQDKHSKISHLNLPGKHIFIKSDMPFNKSWGYNVGLSYSTTENIVFSDCDLIMDPNQLIKSIQMLSEYDMINPYSSVVDLNPNETNQHISEIFKINRPGRGETDHQKVPMCGGLNVFRKDAIMKIGGWCEDFWSWGAEDDYQSIKVENFLNYKELEGRCYHLYHDREQPDMKLYNRNITILQKSKNLSKDDLTKVINSTIDKIGKKNKCTSL